MSESKGQDRTERISLRSGGRRVDQRKGEGQTVRQSFSHGRSKSVAVEVKRSPTGRRGGGKGGAREDGTAAETTAPEGARTAPSAPAQPAASKEQAKGGGRGGRRPMVLKPLTDEERKARQAALVEARKREEEEQRRAEAEAKRRAEEEARRRAEEEARRKTEEEEAARLAEEEAARKHAEDEAREQLESETGAEPAAGEPAPAAAEAGAEAKPAEAPAGAERETRGPARPGTARPAGRTEEEESPRAKTKRAKPAAKGPRREDSRRGGKIQFDAVEGDVVERKGPSLAALRRRQERERRARQSQTSEPQIREVVLPETITVSELANRMAVRGAEVVKALMKMGVMASVTQAIDADTAEVVVTEFGHTPKRVSEADVLEGLEGPEDRAEDLRPRPPVVTVMGHVDHGKTSLLDAVRNADVVAGEAGGITQHIGAYQVDIGTGGLPVTFIDTPGHAAFTEMRSRGAKATDVVILVVAANDGVMPQTVEAINHAKAAGVPIVVAINKVDLADAEPERVKNELLSHELVPEDYGGDIQCIPVSAVARSGLDDLIEAVQLQAEVLELKANPDREAQGVVIEGRLERGRGVVATVLVQRGTLKVGDVVVCGPTWGRVRAMLDDRGRSAKEAGPSVPVEVLGLDGVPTAGDRVDVVDNERRAREIAEYHQRQLRDTQAATGVGGSVDDLFKALKEGQASELPVVVKADVHGSLEAIQAGLEKLSTDEVKVRILHGGVGGITESDITLARASSALVVGFNVRANAQARDLAKRDNIEIRYYSIIYELLDDAKDMLSGMLTPEARETVTGHAEIREVFNITKVGKVAGCRVVDGMVRRGAKVRLLRDDVVVYEGELSSLKRFKEDVREVKEGFECGMAIAGYGDIREGDVIEAYEVQEVARSL
ncbi:MAG: translation initiation factor IF-2 [Alphaproteobacteria bacterium]|jgi:translation initiation factor IF-2|nr:translation initiation factor IF-2 [Alphaproteobacteria bacterium]